MILELADIVESGVQRSQGERAGRGHSRWVAFDLIGVLAGPSWSTMAEAPDRSSWDALRIGSVSEEAFWSSSTANAYRKALRFDSQRLTLVRRLRSRGFRVCLATNFLDAWLRHLLASVDDPPFDACLVSSVVGVAKPQPEFWQLLLHVVPRGTLFVDDQEANCVAASKAGLNSIRARDDMDLSRVVFEAVDRSAAAYR